MSLHKIWGWIYGNYNAEILLKGPCSRFEVKHMSITNPTVYENHSKNSKT